MSCLFKNAHPFILCHQFHLWPLCFISIIIKNLPISSSRITIWASECGDKTISLRQHYLPEGTDNDDDDCPEPISSSLHNSRYRSISIRFIMLIGWDKIAQRLGQAKQANQQARPQTLGPIRYVPVGRPPLHLALLRVFAHLVLLDRRNRPIEFWIWRLPLGRLR